MKKKALITNSAPRRDIKRWYTRARGMSRMELLYIIVGLQHIFENDHPQMKVYRKVAGVEAMGKIAKGNLFQLSEKIAEDKKMQKDCAMYAKNKNRAYADRPPVDWEKAFCMNTTACSLPWL